MLPLWAWFSILLGLGACGWVLRWRYTSRKELEARLAELAALSEAGRAIVAAQLDFDALCELIYRQARQIVDTWIFQLGFFEGSKYHIKIRTFRGERHPEQTFDISDGEGIVGWMRKTKQPLLIRDFGTELDSLPAQPRYISDDPPRSAVFVPLVVGGQEGETVIGAMAIQSHQPGAFTADHQRILTIIANQAAAAIENARLFKQTQHRARQLGLIGNVSQQVAAILDLDTLLTQVVTLIQETFGYPYVHLFTLESVTRIVFRAGTGVHVQSWLDMQLGYDLDEAGLIPWTAKYGEPVLVGDVSQEPRYRRSEGILQVYSELVVPLKVGGQVVGVLDVQSDRYEAFDDEDLFVLQTLSDTVAVAVRNARLYESERRRRQLADTLHQVSALLSSSLETDQVLDRILEGVARVVSYDAAAILLLDKGDQLTVRAARGLQSIVDAVGESWPVTAKERLQRLAQAQRALIFEAEADIGPYHQVLGFPPDHSCMGAPLWVRDEFIGILTVDCLQPNLYGPEDAAAVEALASQASAALENARLYAAEMEKAQILAALLEMAKATDRAESPDQVMETVVSLTPMLVDTNRCAILLWDEAEEAFRVASTYGLEQDTLEIDQWIWPESWPLLDRLVETGSPAVDEFGWMPGVPAVQDTDTTLVALPLRAKGKLIGAMIIGYSDEIPLSESRLQLIAGIANQTAMSIESAQLTLAQQEDAWVSQALLQVAEAVSSTSNLDDALEAVARLTPLLVDVQECLIYYWDEEQGLLIPKAAAGLNQSQSEIFKNLSMPLANWPDLELEYQEQIGQVPLLPGPPAEIAEALDLYQPFTLPLLAWGNLMGAFVVDVSNPEAQLYGRPLNILSGIAQQTATAVQNARLQSESVQRQRLEQELHLALQIQVSFLPDRTPQVPGWDLAAHWRAARRVSGDFYDFIPVDPPNGKWGFVIADVADKGMPAALFMALSRTLVRASAMTGLGPAEALIRANDLILADSHTDLFVTLFYAILDLKPNKLIYANAGHNPPLLVNGRQKEPQLLSASGIALGIIPDIHLEERELAIEPGSSVLLYTDGVIDALDRDENEFGMKRLSQVLETHCQEPAENVIAAINQAIADFVGDQPQFDDFTLLVLKRQASP